MKIKSGNCEVYASGSLIVISDAPLEMTLGAGESSRLFRFSFLSDDSNRDERTEIETAADGGTELRIFNARKAFGQGPQEPVEIGVFEGRKLHLAYRIYTAAPSSEKLLHYTWFLGE
ncbi:MAG: hypothetical protein A2X49_11495 [Lentisphaerae bacterium GWF2_52_8]|nr:MAG: hypothetical protein A2X49_11495 [Lentisphaerae bacterium GWF2_52_8]